ncbi:RAMP superfamily CRISPR-associated protein [Persicobacter psychrovividus]|uniref:CRISPR type III-associated protein domain-containing protein n=1 Tax=Persicobacter psychrovividus TaxID=387638 RepID=A0ABM7VM27_9BACT|nr:hypothetical protein PEPS_43430 [Persicobacter psychrovividus]
MKSIGYQIQFLSDWHAGSGLSAGAEADQLTIKDADGCPFLPGKTIKGLLVTALRQMNATGLVTDQEFELLQGTGNQKEAQGQPSICFFTDAQMPAGMREAIQGKQHFLFRKIASTKIDAEGLAVEQSLRTMEAATAVELEGKIMVEHHEQISFERTQEIFKTAFALVKLVGFNRNRGLGRCRIKMK